jgi:hypothetical protein
MVNTAMEETDWTNARSVQDFTDAMLELEEFNGNPEAVEDFVF